MVHAGGVFLPGVAALGETHAVQFAGVGFQPEKVVAADLVGVWQAQRQPVLIPPARDSPMERVDSLHGGADDFLAKPFELTELEARLVALVRRARGSDQPRFACGPLSYDAATKQFRLGHDPLALTPREHSVLRALIQRSGEPLTKQEIMDRVFSDEQAVNPEAIEVLVYRLRRRLEGSTLRITTLRGLGYVLECVS